MAAARQVPVHCWTVLAASSFSGSALLLHNIESLGSGNRLPCRLIPALALV